MEWRFQINWKAIVEEAKQRRKELKITQQKLAKLAKISTLTVSHFESGENNLRLSSIMAILAVLGMNDSRYLNFSNTKARSDNLQMAIIFLGHDNNKKEIECAISFEALDNYFENNKDYLKTFIANQDRIYHEANKKYLCDKFEANGSILVRSEDL